MGPVAVAPPAVAAPKVRGIAGRWRALRDALLADPRFQRWAAAFPPTRPLVRREARALFDLCAGFVYSQILVACVRLDLFEALAEGPCDAAALARRIGLPAESAERLLAAAAALRLVERRGPAGWGLALRGAALRGNPGVAAMVRHHELLYADLADPVSLLRGEASATRLAGYWPYAGAASAADLAAGDVAAYSALMAASQPLVSDDVLAAWPFRRHRHVLDIGGGEGGFLMALATRAPHLACTLFDLPAVADRARARLAAAGLGARIAVVGGDLRSDPLPGGADLVTLVRVLHDQDDDDARALLAAVRRVLPSGGHLLIAEPMSGTPGAEAAGDAYFGFYLMAMGRGRPRSPAAIAALAREAGFGRVAVRATRRPLLVRVVVAQA